MKTLKKIVKANEGLLAYGVYELSFAEFYYEHNGRKFRVHYDATGNVIGAKIGENPYQSLSIMTDGGAWEQVSDAEVVGAVSYRALVGRSLGKNKVMQLLNDADEKFRAFITDIWS